MNALIQKGIPKFQEHPEKARLPEYAQWNVKYIFYPFKKS